MSASTGTNTLQLMGFKVEMQQIVQFGLLSVPAALLRYNIAAPEIDFKNYSTEFQVLMSEYAPYRSLGKQVQDRRNGIDKIINKLGYFIKKLDELVKGIEKEVQRGSDTKWLFKTCGLLAGFQILGSLLAFSSGPSIKMLPYSVTVIINAWIAYNCEQNRRFLARAEKLENEMREKLVEISGYRSDLEAKKI